MIQVLERPSARPGAAGPGVEELVPPSRGAKLASLAAVILPLAAFVVSIVLLWGTAFSWLHMGLLVSGYVLTALGITVGFHRLFTHRSFRTGAAVKVVLGALGSMAVEGPILTWAATHRRHHQHSDAPGDPHSPHVTGEGEGEGGGGAGAVLRGFLHAHFGWFFAPAPAADSLERYVPDLLRDPVVRRTSRLFPLWVALGLVIPGGVALAVTGSWSEALLGFLWGGGARVFLVHHVTWSVNSVCHLWGTRPFASRDESRNNALFGVLALGEGWHNNHHAFPASARHGLAWWQLDIGYMVIRLMGAGGLAHDIRVPDAGRIALKRRSAARRGRRAGGSSPSPGRPVALRWPDG